MTKQFISFSILIQIQTQLFEFSILTITKTTMALGSSEHVSYCQCNFSNSQGKKNVLSLTIDFIERW